MKMKLYGNRWNNESYLDQMFKNALKKSESKQTKAAKAARKAEKK